MELNGKKLCTYCFEEIKQGQETCSYGGHEEERRLQEAVLAPGTVLMGKYVVGKVLGKGGFGVTYLAYDLKRECKAAIKEYMPDALAYRIPGNTIISTYEGDKAENFRLGAEKFYEEAKTVSRFNGHPNIINVQEFFYENNTAYFVMEYIEGVDLKTYAVQKGGTLSEEECIRLLTPVMDALIVVHSVGVLHRDISPDNIYVTKDGGVKLLDFGAARQVLGEKSKSLSVVLKPGFAPIEQYQTRGKQGQWTDVYALAATMYYCLTGQVPEAAMDRVYEDTNKKAAELKDGVSQQVTEALTKALEVRAENRYKTVYEFKRSIVNMEEQQETSVQGEQKPSTELKDSVTPQVVPSRPVSGRKKHIVAIAAVLLLLLISGSIFALTRLGSPAQEPEDQSRTVAAATVSATGNTFIDAQQSALSTDAGATISTTEATVTSDIQSAAGQSTAASSTAAQSTAEASASVAASLESSIESAVNGTEKVKDESFEYVSIWGYSKYITYSGDWKDGKPNGNGTGIWETGKKYTGEWKDGYPHNQGTWSGASGSWSESGIYYYGIKMMGKSLMAPDALNQSDLNSGKLVSVAQQDYTYVTPQYSVKVKYYGEWKNGKPNGKGFMNLSEDVNRLPYWKKDDFLLGIFNNGNADGNVNTTGDYPEDEIIQKIKLCFASGDNSFPMIKNDSNYNYQGGWRNGLRNGKGTLTFWEGRYEGEWKDGAPTGKGTFYDENDKLIGSIQWNGDGYEFSN